MKQKKPHPYITIAGAMGSGKTTAARLISEEFGFELVEEQFGNNAFLPRFYESMDRWAFHSQTFFLLEKITQLIEIGTRLHSHTIVQDTPIEQDVFSYAKAQHKLKHMDDAEWNLYIKIYHSLASQIPKPSLYIYLETSLPELDKRIASRGRAYEQAIPREYLQLLKEFNDQWLDGIPKSRILRIETDSLNIVNSKKAKQEFLDRVKQRLSQI